MVLRTGQKGHWYKCQDSSCKLLIPLPDKIFLDVDTVIPAECKCGYISYFQRSHAENETQKWELDKYFGLTERPKMVVFWEGEEPPKPPK